MKRRCTAHSSRTGKRCSKAPIKGSNVCTAHGGSAPQVKRSAAARLVALAEPAVVGLEKLLRSGSPDKVRLGAAIAILDRSGFPRACELKVSGSLDNLRSRLRAMGPRADRLEALLSKPELSAAEARELIALQEEAGLGGEA